jgi:hypothetical protein
MTEVVKMDVNSWGERSALYDMLGALRSQDILELNAVRGAFDPYKLERELMGANAQIWLAFPTGSSKPAAAFGFHRMTLTCGGVFAFGTDDWPLVVKGMTRRILRDIMPMAPKWGFHRAECRALASRQDVRRWLLGLGWRAEAVLSEFGTRREDFILYAWTAPHEAHSDNQREHQGVREFSACDA